MNNIYIREIDKKDIPFLWDMLYESLYVPAGQTPFNREILQEPHIAKYVENWGNQGDIGFIAYTDNGENIGSITARFFSEHNKGFGYVSDDIPELGMAIKANYRGKGVGTALLKQLTEALKQKGVEQLSLSVDPQNTPAMKLYERFGFKQVGVVGTSITMVAQL